jgi:hypothetical protein
MRGGIGEVDGERVTGETGATNRNKDAYGIWDVDEEGVAGEVGMWAGFEGLTRRGLQAGFRGLTGTGVRAGLGVDGERGRGRWGCRTKNRMLTDAVR